MSSAVLTLARPYARAAFEYARSNNTLTEWLQQLSFAAQVAADSQVISWLGNPRIGIADLSGLFLRLNETIDSPFGNFIRLLVENRRLALLPEIAALFEELKREAERILKVQVRTATVMDKPQSDLLKAALKKRFGRDIELEQKLDPSVLGGAVIDAGEIVIDGSVSGRLARLEAALTH